MSIRNLIDRTRIELQTIPPEVIELRTAEQWAARAVVALEQYMATGDLTWRDRYATYRHEAIEHAADAHEGSLSQILLELEAEERRFHEG